MPSGGKRPSGQVSPLFRAVARSPYVRYFAPVDEHTAQWSSVLLERYADVYFRRCFAAESSVVVTTMVIWPGMPMWLQIPLASVGAAWTWVACVAAISLLSRGKSLWKALWGRK